MEKTQLLIVDADTRFVEQVHTHMRSHADIELLEPQQNGMEALKRIRSGRPDVVLFDLVLPGMDGISLLRELNRLPDPPSAICCTRFYSDVALEATRRFGASYLIYKPIQPEHLHDVVISCAELYRKLRRQRRSIEDNLQDELSRSASIRNFIVSLGVPSRLIGCSYLTEAVLLARRDMSLLRNLSKGLYLEIARSMDTTPARIERCIRSAVSAAYYGGELRSRMQSCPSNKEFINYILRQLQP